MTLPEHRVLLFFSEMSSILMRRWGKRAIAGHHSLLARAGGWEKAPSPRIPQQLVSPAPWGPACAGI